MKWNKVTKKLNKSHWHLWYAWHPVSFIDVNITCSSGYEETTRGRAWLEKVWRRKISLTQPWEYREYDVLKELAR